jgi:ABC-type sugar transport system ATPase subunit
LEKIDFHIARGEVVTLAGENGAGKSTLVRILTGVIRADSGHFEIDGAPITLRSPADAQASGIAVVYQDFDLAPNLTVAENLMLGEEPQTIPGFVNRRRQRAIALERLGSVGLDLDPDTRVEELGVAQRQLVAIARAMAARVRLLILDEPTSSLAGQDIDHLLKLIEQQRSNGTAVLFISHKLDEVFRISDRICVFRDGRNAGDREAGSTTPKEIVSLMVGRELLDQVDREDLTRAGRPLLEVQELQAAGLSRPVSLELWPGEILGLYGLRGAGRIALLRALFGLERVRAGQTIIEGEPVFIHSPTSAIRAGIGWVSRDRKELGLFSNLDVGKNLTIAALDSVSFRGWIRRNQEQDTITEFIEMLGIKTTGPHQAITALSGGNQQKVLLARWLLTRPQVLILDEPTVGIDVGAKSEIYALMHRLTSEGMGILLVSSELPEVLAHSDRIVIMHEGAINGELNREEANEAAVMALIHHNV